MNVLALALAVALVVLSTGFAFAAKPPGAQVFDVYDNTQDGIQVGTDADVGNVQANANPGGASRLIINAHLHKAAPSCTYTVELVRGSSASNGGLSSTGHTGSIQILGTLTTNAAGNGNAHFDFDPSSDGVPDTDAYGHLDFEAQGTCVESDGTSVTNNEYGGAPDPTLATPLTWKQ